MSNQPTDGGPAFPVIYSYKREDGAVLSQYHEGMSLRAWLAGNLQLNKFDEHLIELYQADGHTVDETREYIAKLRRRSADELIKELNK